MIILMCTIKCFRSIYLLFHYFPIPNIETEIAPPAKIVCSEEHHHHHKSEEVLCWAIKPPPSYEDAKIIVIILAINIGHKGEKGM